MNSEDKAMMDRLRYALCINSDQFLETVAKLLIEKKCSESCLKQDLYIYQYVKMIANTFNSVDIKGYDKEIITDKSLDLFFKLNRKRFNSDMLFKNLWQKLNKYAFAEDISDVNNRIYNIQSLALSIGGFAHIGYLLWEYKEFVLANLNLNNNDQT